MRRLGWLVMAVLSTFVAAYVAALLIDPSMGPPFLREMRATRPIAMYAHFLGAMWALAVGPWQLNFKLRNRSIWWHRWLGRSYVVAIVVGALGALGLAPYAQTGAVARIGFGLLGLLWLGFTFVALREILRRNLEAHRNWMIRSFALTLAAVTLRIYLPLGFTMGLSFEAIYPAIAWLCWVPNLIVAEWFVRGTRAGVAPALGQSA
ncbi:MAG: DUF2306 domain-containing protein [Gemmatimonadales bacterium]